MSLNSYKYLKVLIWMQQDIKKLFKILIEYLQLLRLKKEKKNQILQIEYTYCIWRYSGCFGGGKNKKNE